MDANVPELAKSPDKNGYESPEKDKDEVSFYEEDPETGEVTRTIVKKAAVPAKHLATEGILEVLTPL